MFQRVAQLDGIPDAEILQSGHTWLVIAKWQVIQRTYIQSGDPSRSEERDISLGYVRQRLYLRSDGLPKSDPVYFKSPISWEHLVLSWACLSQQIRNLLRRRKK